MIKQWLVTGDTHGKNYKRLQTITGDPNETAVIILGDAGFNFYLNKSDRKEKRLCQETGYTIYCVRGNHEERPENISIMQQWYDEEIKGIVYREAEFPNIRYLMDGCVYSIHGHSALVIGGAYSVDKWYRLSHFPTNAKWTGWFKDEQLTKAEMAHIEKQFAGQHFDFILSHTCPYSWQPFDLFLGGIDQSTVDNSMELWLDQFKELISWDVWLFAHFHDTRLVRPGAEMYYHEIEALETIYKRWTSGAQLDGLLKKDPNFSA